MYIYQLKHGLFILMCPYLYLMKITVDIVYKGNIKLSQSVRLYCFFLVLASRKISSCLNFNSRE